MERYIVSYNKELEEKVKAIDDVTVLLASLEAESPEAAMEVALLAQEPAFWDAVAYGDWMEVSDCEDDLRHYFNKSDAEEFLGDLKILGKRYYGEMVDGDTVRISASEGDEIESIVCEFNAYMPYGPAISIIVDVIKGISNGAKRKNYRLLMF